MKKISAKLMVTTVEGLMAIVFGLLFIAALVSIAKGAWWHIVTAVISGPLCYMMLQDVKKLYEEEKQYYNDEEDNHFFGGTCISNP